MLRVIELMEKVIPTQVSILIQGETGTEGADRPRDPSERPAPREEFHGGQLRRAPGVAARERALRL
jgi:hypothetical protein